MKLTDHLLSLNKEEFKKATQHPFLAEVGSLKVKPEHLKAWLIQDRYYTGGYIKMMGIMISRLSLYEQQRELGDNDPSYTPERAQRVIKTLAFALSNVHREANFFTDILSRPSYAQCDKVSFEQKDWTTRYVDFHKKVAYESGYDLGEALVVLWAMEYVFYTAWSYAKSINADNGKDSDDIHIKSCHELMSNWTLEEFKQFVDECGSLVNELSFDDPRRLKSFEKVYKDTLALEVKFWDMASLPSFFNNNKQIRKCKDRDGIRITKEYLQSFWSQGQRRPTPDTEEAYNQLVQDFLNKDIALTSEPVIPENFGQNSIETFPQGHLRHGGGVVLQIQDTIDIRYSTLSLLNNLTNATPVRQIYVERNKDDEVDFQRGMLRWTLSDGKNQIQAMEMETIPELSLTTPFGCKILIKSCQVRRGMLLLRRNNVKVMGGAVPELYGGDMLKELENRLKASLGLLENPPQQAPPPPSSLTQRNATLPPPLPSDMDDDVLMDDEFFDDDIDYAELERMEADPIEQFDSTIDDMSLDKDDGFFDDLDQLSLNNNNLSRSVPSNSEFDYDEITLAEENIVSSIQQDTAQPSSSARTINNTSSISLSKKTHATLDDSHPPKKRINLGKKTETASSMTLSKHTVDLTVDDDEEFHPEQSTQAELESVSWIDESVWNDLNEATKESNNGNEGIFVDDQGKTHITFAKLQETLKLMESDNYSSHLPDVVIVRAKCVQFGKLVTSNRLYSLVLYFDDPDQQTGHPVQVVFSNDALTKLLNARRQDVVNVNASGGQKAVLRQIFKPFDKKVRNAIADIEIDLSITQKSNDANTGTSLMPMGIGYTGVSR